MKVLGLIVEYNPMHNGHIYHIQKSKEIVNPDYTIAVMSGHFTQRGEPTILNKWDRTKIALQNGIDLVVELPLYYSVQSADLFARGAISILNHLGVTDICFGTENTDINRFQKIIDIMSTDTYDMTLKQYLSKGFSYPNAFEHSINHIEPDLFSSKPNNILGLQYVKNIYQINKDINIHTITRTSAQYHDLNLSDSSIASATAIRQALSEHKDIASYVPNESNTYLTSSKLVKWDDMFSLLKYKIMSTSAEELSHIYSIEDGLEHLLKTNIEPYTDIENFLYHLTSKRYTKSRLMRSLVYILLNVSSSVVNHSILLNGPNYIKILGFNQNGTSFLNIIKKQIGIQLINSYSRDTSQLQNIDILASNIYSFVSNDLTTFKQEYNKPIIL